MDVISMLNKSSSTAAAEQPKQVEISKPPPRSRTPWDAGGYALPIITHLPPTTSKHRLKATPSDDEPSETRQHHFGSIDGSVEANRLCPNTPESAIEGSRYLREDYFAQESPNESTRFRSNEPLPTPRHYLSDSRSSLSSFASSLSLNSATHSRFSSTSTVSGYQPLGTIADEFEKENRPRLVRSQTGIRSPLLFSPVANHPRSRSVASATEPLSTLALIAERRSQEDLSAGAEDEGHARRREIDTEVNEKSSEYMYSFRSTSPSDALMIKRPQYQELQEPSPYDRKRRLYDPERLHENDALNSPEQRLCVPRPAHKRTLSAPNFKPLTADSQPLSSEVKPIGPRSEPTPPRSSHPDDGSPGPTQFHAVPDTPPESQISQTIPEPRCMYIEDCDTNSTPRKAISHLLGRNKMCTRLIPAHIWVQYCRKHYQRARYRNMGGWPPLQCELVQEQIKRLETWSNENAAKRSGPIVKDWTLALRKREQTRRDKLAKAAAKGKDVMDIKEDSDAEDDVSPAARTDRGDNPPQAVPEWLFEMAGSGYSNAEISAIFDRIHSAILEKELPNMPDIEILPNIIVDRHTPKEPKGYVKRTPAMHQRSRSLGGAALRGGAMWDGRRGSQPGTWEAGTLESAISPSMKRKRFEDFEEDLVSRPMPSSQRQRVMSHDSLARRAGPRRAYSGWIDVPPPHVMHQQQQQQQQQLQARMQQPAQYQQSYVDDLHVRNSHYIPSMRATSHAQHSRIETDANAYSRPYGHAHSQSHSGPISYPSPMMAPQPVRQQFTSTAQQLDTEAVARHQSGMTRTMRQGMHQRSQSDMSFMRRVDDRVAGGSLAEDWRDIPRMVVDSRDSRFDGLEMRERFEGQGTSPWDNGEGIGFRR